MRLNIIYIDDELFEDIIANIRLIGHQIIHFKSADDCLSHLAGKEWEYDLLLIDQKLNATASPNYELGTELGKEIASRFAHLPLIMITAGDYDGGTSNMALAECGFSYFLHKYYFQSDTKDCIEVLKNNKGIRLKWEQRKSLKEAIVKEVFENLESGRVNLAERAETERLTPDDLIRVGDRFISIAQLFCGWQDTSQMLLTDLNKLVRDLLYSTDKIVVSFNGKNWNSGYERKMLNEYLESPHHDSMMNIIEFKALNLLLEILGIRDLYDDRPEPQSLRNKSAVLLGSSCKENSLENDSIFEHKMIARRIFFAHSWLYQEGDDKLTVDMLFSLLKRGITEDTEAKGELNKGEISTKLGLKSVHLFYRSVKGRDENDRPITKRIGISRITATKQTMLKEEFKWVEEVAMHAREVLAFVRKYEVPQSLLYIVRSQFFNNVDLVDFRDALSFVRLNDESHYPEVIQRLQSAMQQASAIKPLLKKYLAPHLQ